MAIRRTQQSQPKQPVAPAEAPKDSVEAKAPETKPEEAQKPEAVQPERPKPGASIPKRAELEQEASRTKDKAEKNLPPSSKVQPTQAQISRFIDNRVQENRHKEGPAFEQESLALQGVKKDMESGKLEPNVAWRRVKEIGAWTDATEKLRVDANTARAEEVEKMNPLQRAGEFWGGVGDGAVDMAKGLHDVAKDINQMNPLYAANNAVIDSVGNFMKTGDLKGSVSDAVNKQLNEMGQATERNLERGKALTNLAWNAGPGYVVNSAVEVANVAGDTLALAQQGKLTPETFLESSKAHALNNPSKRMFKKIGDSFINADRVGGATDPRNIGRTALNVFASLAPAAKGVAPGWLKPKVSVTPYKPPPGLPGKPALPPASSPANPGGWKTLDVKAVTITRKPVSTWPKPTTPSVPPVTSPKALPPAGTPVKLAPAATTQLAPKPALHPPARGLTDPEAFVDTWNKIGNPHNCTYGNCETLADEMVHHLNTGRPTPESLSPVLRNPTGDPRFKTELVDGITSLSSKGPRGEKLITRLDELVKNGRSYEIAIYDSNAQSLYSNMKDHAFVITQGPNGQIIGLDPQNSLVLQRHDLIDVINNADATEIHDVLGKRE